MADEEMKEVASKKEIKKDSWQKDVMLSLHDMIYTLGIIMLVFVLLFRVVVVSGSSMYSTLWDGDWLLVLNNVFYHEPEYGDIVLASKDTFRDGEIIVKRVIATEGQTVDIDFEAGIVYVDGVALEEEYTFTPTNHEEGMEFPLIVKEGCVFLMGDNRNGSRDSRDPDIGHVDKRQILGKAILLVFPGDDKGNSQRDFGRIGAVK